MAIVIRNDSGVPFRIPGKGNQSLDPGGIKVLSEEEFASIPLANRGPGRIYSVNPNESSSETLKEKLDYYIPAGTTDYSVRWVGYARQTALDTDLVWSVRQFSHAALGQDARVTEIQILENVAWADRATLPWI